MILISVLLVLFPIKLSLGLPHQIIFWNVGQGQWITISQSKKCYHLDVGGEFINIKKLSQTCSKKKNSIFYSHWDWDHIGLSSQLKKAVNHLCIAIFPEGSTTVYKRKYLNSIPPCPSKDGIENLKFSHLELSHRKKGAKIKPNDLSHVFIFDNKLLVPGDSPKRMEKIWSPLIVSRKIKWLSVSHHGSKTSTSEIFLRNAKFLTQAIISARKKVYGHPHKITLDRLKKYGIAALKTEDWGNIHILIP